MYSTERANNIEKKDIKFIPAGIHENVHLKSVRKAVSPKGLTFLEITFDKDGASLTHTEWKPAKGQYVKTDEDLQNSEDRQFARMLQILHCLYTDEQLNFVGSSFNEFADWVVNMLDNADKTKGLRAKVVYNKSGYTTLPNYSTYTFIEPMELPEGKTSSIVELGIDQFTKPVVADTEKAVDPLNTTTSDNSTADNSSSDLPF